MNLREKYIKFERLMKEDYAVNDIERFAEDYLRELFISMKMQLPEVFNPYTSVNNYIDCLAHTLGIFKEEKPYTKFLFLDLIMSGNTYSYFSAFYIKNIVNTFMKTGILIETDLSLEKLKDFNICRKIIGIGMYNDKISSVKISNYLTGTSNLSEMRAVLNEFLTLLNPDYGPMMISESYVTGQPLQDYIAYPLREEYYIKMKENELLQNPSSLKVPLYLLSKDKQLYGNNVGDIVINKDDFVHREFISLDDFKTIIENPSSTIEIKTGVILDAEKLVEKNDLKGELEITEEKPNNITPNKNSSLEWESSKPRVLTKFPMKSALYTETEKLNIDNNRTIIDVIDRPNSPHYIPIEEHITNLYFNKLLLELKTDVAECITNKQAFTWVVFGNPRYSSLSMFYKFKTDILIPLADTMHEFKKIQEDKGVVFKNGDELMQIGLVIDNKDAKWNSLARLFSENIPFVKVTGIPKENFIKNFQDKKEILSNMRVLFLDDIDYTKTEELIKDNTIRYNEYQDIMSLINKKKLIDLTYEVLSENYTLG